MHRIRKLFIFILIFCTLFASSFVLILPKVSSQSANTTTYNPDFFWTVSVGATNDETGAAYAGLNLALRPPENLSSWRSKDGGQPLENYLRWKIDVKWENNTRVSGPSMPRIANYTMDEFFFTKRCSRDNDTACGDTWLGFEKKYNITVELIYSKNNVGTSGGLGGADISGDEIVGKITKSVNTGPAPHGGSGESDVQPCTVKNLNWWTTSTENKIYFTWSPSIDACKDQAVRITRPDNSVLYEDLSLRKSSIEDIAAKSGKYTFTSHNTSRNTGTATITVDLNKAILNTSDGPKSPGEDPTNVGSGSSTTATGSTSMCIKNCETTVLGSSFLGTISNPLGQAMCTMQCYIIDFIANMIKTVVNKVLFKSLGI